MTADDVKNLKPGDIVEFSTPEGYWLGRLLELRKAKKDDGQPAWVAINHARTLQTGGIFLAITQHPEHFTVVGFSNTPLTS